jgi:hypothetical protein
VRRPGSPEKIKDAIGRMDADSGLRELLDWAEEEYAEDDEIAAAAAAHKVADANSVTVPAGTYFLGDPCYSVPGHEWDGLLKATNFFEKPAGHLSDGSTQVVAFSTAWGDGIYEGNDGNKYPVDAGLIGLVPVTPETEAELASHTRAPCGQAELQLVQRVTFAEPAVCKSVDRSDGEHRGNVLFFGPRRIWTLIKDDGVGRDNASRSVPISCRAGGCSRVVSVGFVVKTGSG